MVVECEESAGDAAACAIGVGCSDPRLWMPSLTFLCLGPLFFFLFILIPSVSVGFFLVIQLGVPSFCFRYDAHALV